MFGIPGGAILPACAAIARGTEVCATCSPAMSRAQAAWPRLRFARLRQRSRRCDGDRRAPARRTSSRRSPTRGWTRRRSSCPRPGEVGPDRHRNAFQKPMQPESRCRSSNAPGSCRTCAPRVAAGDEERVPRQRSGRPGPVLVDIAKDVQEAEFDFILPGRESDLRLQTADECTSGRSRSPRRRSRNRASRSSAQAAACAGAGASAELLALIETGGLPAVVTLMGKGCLPDSHPLSTTKRPACTARKCRTGR